MSQITQYPTEPHPERLAASEIRTKAGQRLHDVHEAKNYLAMHFVEPVVSVTSTAQVSNIEASPPVVQHIVNNVSEVTPVTESSDTPTTTPVSDVAIAPGDVEAIRAQVAALADTPNAQIARDEYGILS